MTAIATIVAPSRSRPLGGIITDNISWRWIFFINVPVGIAACVAVMALVEDPPWAKAAARNGKLSIDYIGLSLITLGLGSLEIVLDRGEQDDWLVRSPFIRIFARHDHPRSRRRRSCWLLIAKKPVVNIRVLADRNFALERRQHIFADGGRCSIPTPRRRCRNWRSSSSAIMRPGPG